MQRPRVTPAPVTYHQGSAVPCCSEKVFVKGRPAGAVKTCLQSCSVQRLPGEITEMEFLVVALTHISATRYTRVVSRTSLRCGHSEY
ncbi:hypothetical protein AVEN_265481-1 [Araneus ventricosus]|uniref:Uncharacterized protein n=1 Tax=Araneus ventricosus TaxID=182803 RepID=A0A4Y2CGG1_ARAVE|nr:hypothetical protein AVEN_265481-1 [Araneus ventricosus]